LDLALTRRANVKTAAAAADPARFVASGKGPHKRERQPPVTLMCRDRRTMRPAAICDFAVDYADQAERDHKAFVKAMREERVKALVES
jgi:hypothetical protein